MSKPVKALLKKEMMKRFEGVSSLAVVGFTGIDAVSTHKIRSRLRQKDIRMTVVKNSVARQAFKELRLDPATGMLDGPCAVAYGADSVVTVVRELLEIGKDSPNLKIKAALLDGEVFPDNQIERLSKFPTRPEAIGRVVTCVLSPGSKLAGCLIGPASKLAGIIKAVEEKAKSAPETPAPETPAAEAPAAAAAPEAPTTPA
jgi:large subunit ribosomal protein L10